MKYLQNKMHDFTFADVDFSSFIFKVNHVFIWEKENPSEKIVINEEDLDGIEIQGILSLENLLRTVFID